MRKLLLLYNPQSGDGRIRQALPDLCEYYTKNEYEVTVHPTQFPKDAADQIEKRASGFDCITVCGGDGILHEAINGLIRSKTHTVLGYIPTGTVNDFANTHQIPKDIMEAARITVEGHQDTIDAGLFNEEYFSYVAAFGIGTAVSYQTPHESKKILGSLAYILQALSIVDFTHWENNCQNMKIRWQGGECEGDFLFGMVSNSRYVAGMDQFTRDLFDWKDGLLEGLFVRRPMNLTELNTIIGGVARSDFSSSLFVQVQSPWFEFDGDQTSWTLDGEFGGEHTHVKARTAPLAFEMRLPMADTASAQPQFTLPESLRTLQETAADAAKESEESFR